MIIIIKTKNDTLVSGVSSNHHLSVNTFIKLFENVYYFSVYAIPKTAIPLRIIKHPRG